MKKYVKISFTFYKEDATAKKIMEEEQLRTKLKPYVIGNGGWVIGDYYKLEYPSELYSEVLKFAKNKRCVDLHVYYFNEYNSDELERAKIFWLRPKKTYIQNKEIFEYSCEKCTCRNLINRKQIVIDKDIKSNQPKRLFKIGEGMEELNCVSVELFRFLIENGVSPNDFSPVIKGNEIKAYAFTPEKVCNIMSDVYKYKTCKKCGRIYAEFDKRKRNHYEQLTLCDQVDFLEHDIYKTLQFYDGEQKIMISPKLYYLLKAFMKSEEAIPIFEEKSKY